MQPLAERIEARTAVVGVIGQGYVGLPLATGIAPCPAPPPQLLQLCWHPVRSTAAPGSSDETPRTRA